MVLQSAHHALCILTVITLATAGNNMWWLVARGGFTQNPTQCLFLTFFYRICVALVRIRQMFREQCYTLLRELQSTLHTIVLAFTELFAFLHILCRTWSNWERVKCSGMQRRVRPRSIRGWMAAWVGQSLPVVGTKCHHAPSNMKYHTPYLITKCHHTPSNLKYPHNIADHRSPWNRATTGA